MKKSMTIIISFLCALSLSAQVNFNNNTVNAGNYSSALGENNSSTGLYSLAIGKNDTVPGDYSFAGGINSYAGEGISFAYGHTAKALGPHSYAIGGMVTASNNSFALGSYCKANGTNSFVIGTGQNSTLLLENSISYSLMIGINSNRPTFFVSSSAGADRTGKIGIGDVTDPESKLHIKADENELAEVFIESNDWGGSNAAFLWLGTKEYGLKAAYNRLEFKTSVGGKYTFIDGNVGIGTYTPSEKLEVAGKIKTTGFQLANGQPGEGKYLRSDANGNANWANSNVPCLDCLASGQYASTIGMYDTATEIASLAFGYNAKALGSFALAIGKYVTSHGASSVTIGRYLQTNTSPAIILGCGVDNTNRLQNNIPNSLMVGFGSIKSTLFVGPSIGSSNTGKIGIGDVTDPQAKLHIKADQYETASLFIEPYMFGGNYTALLWMGTQEYGLKAAYGRMYFNTGGNYIFNSADAKVGIGTLNPLAKLQVKGDVFIEDVNAGLILKSPDGQCWKITVNNSGELTTTSIDCNLTTGAIDLPQPEEKVIRIYPNPAENNITIENTGDNEVFATLRGIDGILITTRKLQTGNNTLNLENLTPGYYIVTILDNKNRVITSEKIIKK